MSGHDLCGWYSDSCHTFHSNKKHRKVVAALWCALFFPRLRIKFCIINLAGRLNSGSQKVLFCFSRFCLLLLEAALYLSKRHESE